jgi:serine/threonine protein kinase
MPPSDWDRIQSVFLSVADLSPVEQAGRLVVECGDDDNLRNEVESLLASDREGPKTISAAIAGEAALLAGDSRLHSDAADRDVVGAWISQAGPDSEDDAGKSPREKQRVGQWRLIRRLGQGGMGTVYLAERADGQYESQAAIKLLRRGLDTDFILHRFRRERQILARLDHPNITRMFDGGTTDEGIPYFVMEYVAGPRITNYAAEHNLSVKERIRLCLPVCAAVAYAHRNFVVHRDLKPGNILIDASGAPKLLDFGVSKLLHSEQPEPGDTEAAALMTPDYASPEQILGDPVTVASDIYSMGAVIYRLVANTLPHRIEQNNPLAIERAICLDGVTPPSSAASGNAALARCLRGDLDSIIMRAMQKEPARRYASMELLAEDLRRYLDHRPVGARGDSAGYRVARFIRRNRVPAAVGVAAFLAVVSGAFIAGRATGGLDLKGRGDR